jgi:NADH dehydrogenase FAD-containing subunit
MQILPASLIFQHRTTVNTRIVVVGASDTGLSFLESLVYTPHLHFTGLTLITDDDFPSTDRYKDFVSNRTYSPIASKQVSLQNYIQILRGSAVKIERDKKVVKTSNEQIVSYDYLFLTSGLQFHSSSIHLEFGNLSGVINLNRTENTKILESVDKIVENSSETSSQIVL